MLNLLLLCHRFRCFVFSFIRFSFCTTKLNSWCAFTSTRLKKNTKTENYFDSYVLSFYRSVCQFANVVSNVSLSLVWFWCVACVYFKCHISKSIVCYLLQRHSHTATLRWWRCVLLMFVLLTIHTKISAQCTTAQWIRMNCNVPDSPPWTHLRYNGTHSIWKEKQTADIHFLFIKSKQNCSFTSLVCTLQQKKSSGSRATTRKQGVPSA